MTWPNFDQILIMNASNLHLVLNHIPILGILFGALVLAGGLIFKSKPVQLTGLITFVVTAALAFPVMKTGDEAEHTVEHIAGISEELIEEHEELAETAIWLTSALGILSLAGIILSRREKIYRFLPVLIFVAGIAVFAWMVRVGNSGGNIRHPELTSPAETDH